jgi:hypothetical protein
MAATTWGSYIDAFATPTVTKQMPDGAPFFGTAGRQGYTGVYSVLGNYSVFTAYGGGASKPGGPRVLSGIVRKPDNTAAVGYEVRLYSQTTGQLLDTTISGASGEFSFDQLDTAKYYVVAVDGAEVWKAPIKDLITPAVP